MPSLLERSGDVVGQLNGDPHEGDCTATGARSIGSPHAIRTVRGRSPSANDDALAAHDRITLSASSDRSQTAPSGESTGAHRGPRQRRIRIPDRRVRWLRSCYPAVTPALELARFEFRNAANIGRSIGGPATCKRLCAREIRCDLYVTYELGKWSGRLDSNQRPPAPKAGALPGCATPRLHNDYPTAPPPPHANCPATCLEA